MNVLLLLLLLLLLLRPSTGTTMNRRRPCIHHQAFGNIQIVYLILFDISLSTTPQLNPCHEIHTRAVTCTNDSSVVLGRMFQCGRNARLQNLLHFCLQSWPFFRWVGFSRCPQRSRFRSFTSDAFCVGSGMPPMYHPIVEFCLLESEHVLEHQDLYSIRVP